MFSTLTQMPELPNTDFLFGVGTIPDDAGAFAVPDGFGEEQRPVDGPKD